VEIMMEQFEDKAYKVKVGLAEMLKGGVIMDVTTAEQAKIAEQAGAAAVMALERVPSDIRAEGGVARMADPDVIEKIKRVVTIPVMAKCRIGHIVEARLLEAMEVDFIDESEVLTPADNKYHVDKWRFKVPFVCGCRNIGEALRRISEGAAMIRTKGEAGTGDVSQAVKHLREINSVIKAMTVMSNEELYGLAKENGVSVEIARIVAKLGKLPVPNFAAGGVATPADAALCMQLGAEAVFVGSGIFKSGNPEKRAKAIVSATTHYQDYTIIVEQSRGLGEPMKGIAAESIPAEQQLQVR
jgi:pyridoxal 5'-phosphate synthase pdxS subunit